MSTPNETAVPRRGGPTQTHRAKRGRGAIAAVAVIGMSFAAFGLGAQAAVAAPVAVSAASNASVDAHPQDTGTIRIDFGTNLAGFTVTSTASDPTQPGSFSVVSGDVGSDGYVTLTNYAGFADIDLTSYSAPSTRLGSQAAPTSFRYDVSAWRAQTVEYTYSYNANGANYALVGAPPQLIIPATSQEAESLTAVATTTISPTSWQPGSDVTLNFTNVTPTGVGYPYDTVHVQTFVYSSPTDLGASAIYEEDPQYSVTVPGAFTSGGHVVASFDGFGRLFALDPLGAAPSTPVATATAAAADSSSSLANTGQNDLIPAGIAAIVLFGAGATVLVVSYRRRASARRD